MEIRSLEKPELSNLDSGIRSSLILPIRGKRCFSELVQSQENRSDWFPGGSAACTMESLLIFTGPALNFWRLLFHLCVGKSSRLDSASPPPPPSFQSLTNSRDLLEFLSIPAFTHLVIAVDISSLSLCIMMLSEA